MSKVRIMDASLWSKARNFVFISFTMEKPETSFAQTLSAYHTARWKHVRKQIKQVSKEADTESVHKARVEIKKLAAFYDLISYCVGGFHGKRELKDLTKTFKSMGKVRDQSNIICLCEKFKIDATILDGQKISEASVSVKVKSKYSKHKGELAATEKAAARRLDHVSVNEWQAYLKAKQEKISSILSSTPALEELHHTRKDIKHLLYNSQIAKYTSVGMDELKRLDKLQTMIGDWHDLLVLKTKLLKLRIDQSQPEQYKAVKSAEQRLKRQINSPRGRAQTQRSSA